MGRDPGTLADRPLTAACRRSESHVCEAPLTVARQDQPLFKQFSFR